MARTEDSFMLSFQEKKSFVVSPHRIEMLLK